MIDVAAIGDVSDINCWSNIPFHFFEEGYSRQLFQNPWKLELAHFVNTRRHWNFFNLLRFSRPGGYQFSKEFLDKAEASIPEAYFSNTIISFNQVFPRAETVRKAGGKIIYYVDMTLTDLFSDPLYRIKIGAAITQEAILQEAANYRLAERVITMGAWPLETLRNTYHLPENKLGCILPGANLKLTAGWSPRALTPGAGVLRDLVLGFVGKDWERKGLEVLINLKNELQLRGYKIKLKIIGTCPLDWQTEPGVKFLGKIDKLYDSDRFIREISSCDIGCLFSKGEALGISVLEFLAVGVPVAGYYYQGMKDTLLPNASLQFRIDDTIMDLSDGLQAYINNSQYQQELKNGAIASMNSVTWGNCIDNWLPVLEAL